VFPSDPEVVDLNPLGGTRGGRGVAIVGDQVLVNSYHSIIIHNRGLDERRRITHPLMAGLHELADARDGTLWVAATATMPPCASTSAPARPAIPSGHTDAGLRWRLQIEHLRINRRPAPRVPARAASWRPRPPPPQRARAQKVNTARALQPPRSDLDLDANELVLEHPELRMGHNLLALDDAP